MKPEIPDKLYFKIGEAAKMAEVATHVLRYWESEFAALRPKRAGSGQRLYRKQDVELILKIKTLLHEQGYTLAGARKFVASGADVQQTVPESDPPAQHTFDEKLNTIKQELKKLQILLTKDQQ